MAALTLPGKIALVRRDQGRQEGGGVDGSRGGGRAAPADGEGRRRPRQGPHARDDPRTRQAAGRPRASTRSGRSRARSASCRARTAPRSSPAARRRRSSPRRSAPPTTPRSSRSTRARASTRSCSTTTSRPSRSARRSSCAARRRREIGHGNLARRALSPVLPTEDAFPYTVRVVSDILESNGSSSMATVCGGTLALMDAGRADQVAGRGRGDGPRQARATSSPSSPTSPGQEDHYGDMDFKVAGTRDGHHRTADGHQDHRASPARSSSRRSSRPATGRLHILEQMAKALARRAPSISPLRAAHLHDADPARQDPRRHRPGRQDHPLDHRGDRLQDRRRGRRQGHRSPRRRGGGAARRSRSSRGSPQVPEIGKIYTGKVRRVEPFGAFVEILPGQDGLVHISELAPYRVRRRRRRQGRRRGHGQDHRGRPDGQDQALPQAGPLQGGARGRDGDGAGWRR